MPMSRWIQGGLLAGLICGAQPAGADPAPPRMLEGEAKEALRLQLVAAFAALPFVNQTFELTAVRPDEPASNVRIDLWSEGDTGCLSLIHLGEDDGQPPILGASDGIVLAVRLGSAAPTLGGPGPERLRQRHRTAEAAARTMHTSWGTPPPEEARVELVPSLWVRPIPGDSPFKFEWSLAAGPEHRTPSWLSAELWQAASAEQRPDDGTVVLRELPVETTLRTKDGLLLRIEAHDEARGRHVLLTLGETTRTPSDWRGQVRDTCQPLHEKAREPHAMALAIDAGCRLSRVGALLKVPQEPAVPDATLGAWAQFLVETEKAILALDDWTPETAAKQRDVVHKALLAAIREMAPKASWPAERAARFAAHVSARWAAVIEPPPAAPARSGEAR